MMESPPRTPTRSSRKALHERSPSQLNAAVRLVPYSPPRLLTASRKSQDENSRPTTREVEDNQRGGTYLDYSNVTRPLSSKEQVYSRTPLPTDSAHVLPAPSFAIVGLGDSAQTTEGADETQGSHASVKQHQHGVSQNTPKVYTTQSAAPAIRTLQNKVSHTTLRQPQSSDDAYKAKPLLRRKKEVSLDPGSKTFKITDFLKPAAKPEIPRNAFSRTDGQPIPVRAPATQLISHESVKQSLDGNDLERSIQSTASCTEDSFIPPENIVTSTLSTNFGISGDHIASDSPLGVDLVGGLRINNASTLGVHQDAVAASTTPSPILSPPSDSDLPEPTGLDHTLSEQHSFDSILTVSTLSDNANYKVYGTSPDSTRFSASSSHEVDDHDANDLPIPPTQQQYDSSVIDDLSIVSDFIPVESDQANYEVYGDSSPAPSSIVLTNPEPNFIVHEQSLAAKSSQDSLAYSFLAHPHRSSDETQRYRPSTDTYRTYRTQESRQFKGKLRPKRSGDTLHTRQISLASSIGTVISAKEARRAVRHKSSIIHLPALKTPIIWAAGKGPLAANEALMQASPHVWSSQLSTVASESEGSNRGSRSLSQFSMMNRGDFISSPVSDRGGRLHSLASIEGLVYADTLNRPIAAYTSSSGGNANWDEHLEDEDGDVLEDMPRNLRPQRSKARISGMFNSVSDESGRTSTMRSTTSTRSMTNSIYNRTIPEWARVYYGSGERKFLVAPSSSHGGDSRPASTWSRSGSPDTSNFPTTLFSPRRRPHENQPQGQRFSSISTASRHSYRPDTNTSMAIRAVPNEVDAQPQQNWIRRMRSRTSSVWSPHLGQDRRAEAQSAWVAPSMIWSEEPGVGGVRNRQMIMFIVGFIFPFSWMIAALLPISEKSHEAVAEMEERSDYNASSEELQPQILRDPAGNEYQVGQFESNLPQGLGITMSPKDEKRLRSARWWRNLNRWMSILGLIIVALVVVLIVVGIREGWTK